MNGENTMRAVIVDPAMFKSVTFLQAVPKMDFNADRNAPKVQKRRADVPVWTVRLSVMMEHNGRLDADTISVSVPAATDPAQEFAGGDLVTLDRLQFGVADTKSGYSLWYSADAMHPAAVTVAAR